jgi:beta-glucanase (GH16 family)
VIAALAGCSTVLATAPAPNASRHQTSGADAREAAARLIWSDDFNGPAGAPPDPAKWHAVTGPYGADSHELEYYTDRSTNVTLDGAGNLVITARRETYSGDSVTRQYTSARIETGGLFQTMYRELDARIKLPEGQGLWPAFWALGSDYARVGWPGSGEIDMMEELGKNPFVFYGSIHGPSRASPDGWTITVAKRSRASLAARFHVYGVRWSPGKVVFTLDGVPYGARTRADLKPGDRWALNHPFYLLLDLAVGGDWPGSPNASTPFPARMLVDWVRVYS